MPAPILATVFLGANDAALDTGASSRQHVPLRKFRANIEAIVVALKGHGVRHILLITPPPVDEPARLAAAERRGQPTEEEDVERKDAVTRQYGAAVLEVHPFSRHACSCSWPCQGIERPTVGAL